jgi:DNA-binding response OmpR family regulator
MLKMTDQNTILIVADHYLTRPFEPEDLLVAIEARLQRVADIQAAAPHEIGPKGNLSTAKCSSI